MQKYSFHYLQHNSPRGFPRFVCIGDASLERFKNEIGNEEFAQFTVRTTEEETPILSVNMYSEEKIYIGTLREAVRLGDIRNVRGHYSHTEFSCEEFADIALPIYTRHKAQIKAHSDSLPFYAFD